jgi:hypothetical protein
MPDVTPGSCRHAYRSVADRLVGVVIAIVLAASVGLIAAVSLAALASLAASADQDASPQAGRVIGKVFHSAT